MTDRLVEGLFLVTGVLLPPVLVALIALSAATLWMLGEVAREAWDRRRARVGWRRFLGRLEAGRADVEDFGLLALSGYPARFQRYLREAGPEGDADGARKCLDDLELEMARRLSWLTFATRVGPMLGLVGTLLPLGPALRGLASEDLGSLAGNLEVAFTSTVFGLLIGGLAYAAGVVRRNGYEQDLSDLEFLARARVRDEESSRMNGPNREVANVDPDADA